MAIGSLDKAGRLEQLKTYAKVQVWSGYKSDDDVYAEVYAAVLDEENDPATAEHLATDYIAAARQELVEVESAWPQPTEFERLQAAFSELRAKDVIVLEACDDHWAANRALSEAAERGESPRGVAYFTHADVWHAVEHEMLELNVWHGSSANVAPGDDLLDLVEQTLAAHGIPSHFDEGRIEVTVAWQRRDTQIPHAG